MIGILAGMGPKSTGPFVDLVVEECQKMYGAKYDIDYPEMMIYSCPTPFYLDRPINHLEMEKAIVQGARRLDRIGIDFLAIPCNTAHIYFDEIAKSVSTKIINMIDETINVLGGEKKVAVFATEMTIDSGIYQTSLINNNYDYINNPLWQCEINSIIHMSKLNTDIAIEKLDIFSEKISKEVDTIIFGCTDLTKIVSKANIGFSIVDSSRCLAQAVVREFLK